jgi:hypothetical protein
VVRATELSDAYSIVTGGEVARLSPSQVESFTRCGRWLLEAAVGADGQMSRATWVPLSHAAAVLAVSGVAERRS